MNNGTGTSKSTASSPISSPVSSKGSPASILERRNRRRSSALKGSHPADVPLTDSDQRLAATIARINLQNTGQAASRAPQQSLPTLVVPPLILTSDSAKAIEEPSRSTDKTPTQATFRNLSTQRTARAVVRSHVRDGSRSTTTFHLYPIQDQSESKTPTQQDPNTSPIRAKPNFSALPSSSRDEPRRSPNRVPLNSDYELSRTVSPCEFQLSPYRLFTRRMYTNSPLDSTSHQTEEANIEQPSGKSYDTEGASDLHSPREPFPPFEQN